MIVNGPSLLIAEPIKDMLDGKYREHGVSHGLTEAGYDIRLKQDIRFYPPDTKELWRLFAKNDFGDHLSPLDLDRMKKAHLGYTTITHPDGAEYTTIGRFLLASAVEEFHMPKNLTGVVHDKSTWARCGNSVFNTVIEPGWNGFLTLEIVHHGNDPVHLPAGAGVAQILFSQMKVLGSYEGKYQNQPDKPVKALAS